MTYNPRALDHFRNPRNVGKLDAPTAVGAQGVPGRGNYMVIHLRVEARRIVEIAFQTHGCAGAIACGSAATEMAKGCTLEEAEAIDRKAVEQFLGGLPLGKGHCADLAVGALRDALRKCGADSHER